MTTAAKWFVISFVLSGFPWIEAHEETDCEPAPEQCVQMTLPSTISVTRAPDITTFTPSDRKYTVEFAFFGLMGGCESCSACSCPEGEHIEIEMRGPKLTVRDGERITATDAAPERFVVAEKADDGAPLGAVAITRQFDSGSTIECTVLGLNENEAMLDIGYEFRIARHVPDEASRGVRVEYVKGRAVQCVELGERTRLDLKHGAIEAIVNCD